MAEIRRTVPVWVWFALGVAVSAAAIATPLGAIGVLLAQPAFALGVATRRGLRPPPGPWAWRSW